MTDKRIQKWFCYGKKDFCDTYLKCDKCKFFGNPYGGELRRIYETNYDRIRNMSVEELAEFITCIDNGWVTETGREICKEKHLKYLESEVDNNG